MQFSENDVRDMLAACRLCPHECGVNRLGGQIGRCGAGSDPVVYRYGPHHGEEPPISGWNGSGTIFFSGCPMSCIYCQNHRWSQTRPLTGSVLPPGGLSRAFLNLQRMGCHNVNLVTPEPWVPHILMEIQQARREGLMLPVVYNSSGFVSTRTLGLLTDFVDVYLTDIRYESAEEAARFSSCGDYFASCRESAKAMWRQVGTLRLDDSGIAERGLIVRHLLLPGATNAAKRCLEFIADELSREVYVSLLAQFEPVHKARNHGRLGHHITPREYREALRFLRSRGLRYGWKQRLSRPDGNLLGTDMEPSCPAVPV